jgi:2-C-methyl-D-erythritol 4-phosphate cytidylyltransferase/2-C-methyl-D-erythritol 2,4-cyclodiphosphate synthase
MRTHAIIVAAGQGSRTGSSIPKQFEPFAGKPLYRWSVDVFASHPDVETVVIVLPASSLDKVRRALAHLDCVKCIAGGHDRSASVRNGLSALPAERDDFVLVHDAARPGLTGGMIDQLISALGTHEAAAPALSIADAVKRQDSHGLQSVDREDLFRVQTPQAFRAAVLKRALADDRASYVDDLAAVEGYGESVTLVPGDERLSKITYAEDFRKVRSLMFPAQAMRTGAGFDVHRLVPGDGLTLCGVYIKYTHALKGHSDADVGWHALTDAIFGALALGDLGDHFPPSDDRWKGADSATFLNHAMKLARDRGWELVNCDITLICEQPKIKPHRDAMRGRTSQVTGLALDAVSIKATTSEGLGYTGRGEGIAAQATVMMRQSGY